MTDRKIVMACVFLAVVMLVIVLVIR